jgi:glutamyl/glutaminyl-tRNA synthetase
VADGEVDYERGTLEKHFGKPAGIPGARSQASGTSEASEASGDGLLPAYRLLAEYRGELAAVEPFDAPTLEASLRAFVERRGVKLGQVIHALRFAVTGKSVGFGMFEILEILGRDATLARIDRALAAARAV